MGAVITVREVFRRVSVLLLDIDPQFTRYREKDMVDAFNDGQRALYTYLPTSCSRLDTIRLVPGTVQSIDSIPANEHIPADGGVPTEPLIGSMLLDVLMNMGAAGNTPGVAIRPLTDGREVLDTLNPSWHAQSGDAVLNFILDPRFPRQFLVYPGVPVGRLWVKASLVSEPKAIPNVGEAGYATYADSGTNTLKMSVHDSYVADMVHYVAARMLMQNAQFAKASGMSPGDYEQLFTGSINARSQALLGHSPNLKRLPFAPEPVGAAS